MNQPWQIRRPDLLDSMKAEVRREFQNLRFVERNGGVFVIGSFPITDGDKILDRYQVEVEFPPDYPGALPIVRETGGRIPRIVDRHVNPKDGALCVGLTDALWMDGTAKAPFIRFLEGPVRTYLMGNSLVERGDPWPYGEWGHGGKGVLQYYSQLFATQDPLLVARLLNCAYDPNIPGHFQCPCKGGRIFRRCHSPTVREIEQKVPRAVLERSLAELLTELKRIESEGSAPTPG